MAKEIFCGFGVDVDAVAGWLGSYGGEDSPDDISRGIFAGEVGSLRLLKLFDFEITRPRLFVNGATASRAAKPLLLPCPKPPNQSSVEAGPKDRVSPNR